MASHPPIAISQLADVINRLKANEREEFSREYESIEPGQPFTWEASSADVNKSKNRYANVTAYDHSRVALRALDGVVGSDYINANFMDGYCRPNAYIATQGPLPETFGDFWRMIYEQRTTTIVMMTKLEERNRVGLSRQHSMCAGHTLLHFISSVVLIFPGASSTCIV